MNLTVGPLPPAVYWRRRAIVLGGLLLVVLLIAYACSGSGTSNASAQHVGGSVTSPSPSDSDSIGVVTAPASQPPSTPSSVGLPPSPSATPTPTTPATTSIATCTDAQIRVTPVISSTSVTTTKLLHGGTYDIKLKVRNVSAVACRRDVGSVPESLVVTQGSTKIWSSDDCVKTAGKAHDVRTFGPDIEIFADVKWSSYNITTTTCKKSPLPVPVGTYSLTGTVGTEKATVEFSVVS
jgi:hypothetical protein